MKVFYHNDADGKCAAYIVRMCLEREVEQSDSDYIEMDYHKAFPLWDVNPDETVYIVDFSIEPETMRALLEITGDVRWIDHHVSSINKYDHFETGISGLRSIDYSGCELTWIYLYRGIIGHKINVDMVDEDAVGFAPLYVRLIGDRDTWKFNLGDDTRFFHEAFKAAGEPGPFGSWWNTVSSDERAEVEIVRGEVIYKATCAFYRSIVDRSAYEVEFEGHTILVCNCPIFTSELFGDRVNDYPFVSVFCYLNGKWKVSLYSENMDVVQYAEKRGGGGHARACGFVSEENPFKVT